MADTDTLDAPTSPSTAKPSGDAPKTTTRKTPARRATANGTAAPKATPRKASTARNSAGSTNGTTLRKRADKVIDGLRGGARTAIKTVRDDAKGAANKVEDAAGAARKAAGGAVKSVKDALPTVRRTPERKAAAKPARARTSAKGTSAGTVIGIAAAGIAAGVALNLGRKAAVQAPSALAGDWFEALKGEHRAVLTLFDALQATSDSQTHRRSVLLIQIKHALTKHALTEENTSYPALRHAGEKAEADKLNHEHGYVKDYLYQLEMMPNSDPGFLAKVAEFRTDLESHIREEEDVVFPALHAKLGEAKNKALTLAANKEGFKAA